MHGFFFAATQVRKARAGRGAAEPLQIAKAAHVGLRSSSKWGRWPSNRLSRGFAQCLVGPPTLGAGRIRAFEKLFSSRPIASMR
jgi:hypothetical protein